MFLRRRAASTAEAWASCVSGMLVAADGAASRLVEATSLADVARNDMQKNNVRGVTASRRGWRQNATFPNDKCESGTDSGTCAIN